jgi:DNA-directed RNA polymerase specialized sigma24 family protein
MATMGFDDQEARRLLRGSAAEIGQGLTLIDRELHARCCAALRKRFPWLGAEDVTDVWQETLLRVLEAARSPDFDWEPPLLPWLWTVAHDLAVDLSRRQAAWQAAVAAVGEALRASQTGTNWKLLSEAERHEIMQEVAAADGTLSARQRLVYLLFVEGYPATGDMEVLRKAVSRATGEEESLGSVKRVLQEARRKVQKPLRARGYGLGPV